MHATPPYCKAALLCGPARSGYSRRMSDQVFFPLLAVLVAGLIALALVWPQGRGAPSPPPFRHRMAPLERAVKLDRRTIAVVPEGAPPPKGTGAAH